ncbi:protein of unknown function DUF1311 [Crinalium epipsammum PCC 9333]|uniref:Lysozyme inhibitor LprI-like N-terminal domain-containing protein n=1 Tax=Crinalium epipsammum PCC 9333 TaxID=1173022 RepID=K9VTX9_9CYAN|nr:lysozyme inhibitor LprI family protein [Crinalium epipsammum]AFZ11416.1 protein of unknown function DUF1311 [Crinalium epipsammum PCC 9333]
MLKKSIVVTILLATGYLSVPAVSIEAAPPEKIAQKINCNAPSSGVEEKYCAGLAYEAVDKRLNQVYRQLTSKLAGTEKQRLVEAQLAWIKYRDKNCDFETYSSRNGTGYSVFLRECLQRITQQRINDLKQYVAER